MSGPANPMQLIRESGPGKVFHAGWVMKDARTILADAYLEVANGAIQKVSGTRPKGDPIHDLGPGLIMPALVNAHLHLELSALAGRLPRDKGFQAWVAALIREREALGPETLVREANQAVDSLASFGLGLVGEISTLGLTKEPVSKAGLSGVWFHEFLGTDIPDLDVNSSFPMAASLAGHAPHTTGPDLLKWGKARTRAAGLPFSIHTAESNAEMDFINGIRGDWFDFLVSRGIDTRGWPIGNKTPVQYLDDLNLLDRDTLCVHLLHLTDPDLAILVRCGVPVCLCPRSNLILHDRLPDVERMLASGLAPALGTDSLASCPSLNILDETAFIRKHFPNIHPRTLVEMVTVNGARALGLDALYGTLTPGKKAEFVYADVPANTTEDLIERLTLNAF